MGRPPQNIAPATLGLQRLSTQHVMRALQENGREPLLRGGGDKDTHERDHHPAPRKSLTA